MSMAASISGTPTTEAGEEASIPSSMLWLTPTRSCTPHSLLQVVTKSRSRPNLMGSLSADLLVEEVSCGRANFSRNG